ncbi:MAG: hypothetical protein ABSB80_09690 [Methanoregula sp.]|jgi:hypothetical protein|uniref:hypothetical protein n=1 Tax=Methanoregula sp. TaxID=2052170 RepID=UPI003D0DB09B
MKSTADKKKGKVENKSETSKKIKKPSYLGAPSKSQRNKVAGKIFTTTDRNAPDRTAPDCTVPDCTKPDCTVPDCTKPDCTVPDCTKPDCTVPDCTKPDCTPPSEYGTDWGNRFNSMEQQISELEFRITAKFGDLEKILNEISKNTRTRRK